MPSPPPRSNASFAFKGDWNIVGVNLNVASGASHRFHPVFFESELQWEILQKVPLNVSTVRDEPQSPGENSSGRFLLQFVVSTFFGFTNFFFSLSFFSFKCLQSVRNLSVG